jgi:aspartate aminotransferase-like enzyme
MPARLETVDPNGLLEFSAVFTDRSLNHMSQSFQRVMRDISACLKGVYNADSVVVIPGSGTFAMEAVARQFATGKRCLVIRNGLFSYRWTQIFDMGGIPAESTALKARPMEAGNQPAFAPPPVDEVVAAIKEYRPDLVFAPHVETSAGLMLPDQYIRKTADAVHDTGGMLVLDCISSGAIWVDMKQCGVDILLSAPQKGWSSFPCCGLVMLGSTAVERLKSTTSTSFACDLRKWHEIMTAYENNGHAYHATMPTDGLRRFRDMMRETEAFGFEKIKKAQQELGDKVKNILARKNLKLLAAEGFQAPGVIVCHTDSDSIRNGNRFTEAGIQIAPGVPIECDELETFKTFRIGLFGLDKLKDVDGTVARLEEALDRVFP